MELRLGDKVIATAGAREGKVGRITDGQWPDLDLYTVEFGPYDSWNYHTDHLILTTEGCK